MYQQQSPPPGHSGLAVVLGWIIGVPFSIWVWPHIDPLIRWFLGASIHTIGKDIAVLLYFIAPFALFLLTLWVIMFVVDDFIIDGIRFGRSLEKLGRWLRYVRGERSSWGWLIWTIIGASVVFVALGGKT